MEPGETCNLRTQVFPGVPRNVPFISFIISSLHSLSYFENPILQQLKLLDLSSLSQIFSYVFQLCLFMFWEIFFNSVLQITNFIIGCVLFLSPLLEIFKCNPLFHSQT